MSTDTSPLYVPGQDPDRDAWLTNFYTENHLAYETFPDKVASPEQLNFIVHMDGEPYYYPCSDELFAAIIEKRAASQLNSAYGEIWTRVQELVTRAVQDRYRREYMLSLLSIKYQHEISSQVLLPTRLEKRLLGIFTTISEISRPLADVREAENRQAARFLASGEFRDAFIARQGLLIEEDSTLDDMDVQVHLLKLRRLLLASSVEGIWQGRADMAMVTEVMNREMSGQGWTWLGDKLRRIILSRKRSYLLWIAGRSGETVFDLAIIRLLMNLGVKVILAVKQGFFYRQISFGDVLEDPVMEKALANASLISDPAISKNELLRRLHQDNRLLVISDGTSEQFNPLRTSVTFARAFKEADFVINRCPGSWACINNRFRFTRDVISIVREDEGRIAVHLKEHHPAAIRFSESDLRAKAQYLINMAKKEKQQGKKIMFYSAIVGSIPGQLAMAKKILNVFVEYLRSTLEDVVIINPGEYFEEGMDADDIMYMWEIFQRSGVIDIWRFQTVADIEKAFELMGEKVPPEWSGKDATYSTGCTKEMEIAMDLQKKYPEMQVIGPPWEKFQRRNEYGVGKLYDRTLVS
jgi:uncharacterized protein with ATP-grasp and redox domains